MQHRAEARSAGRHRGDSRARHRAPLPLLGPTRAVLRHSGLAAERHRTTLLTATLGAALVAGVAGGTAAAAATNRQAQAAAAVVTTPEKAATAEAPLSDSAAAAPRVLDVEAHVSADPSAFPLPHADPSTVPTPHADPSAVPTPPYGLPALPARPPGLAALPARPAGLSAVPARQKERPKPVAAAPRKGAAWVHPLPAGHVTSCFGPRWGRQHAGVDLAAPHGTPIVAAGAGVVVRAGEAGGYGIAVLIDHGNGYLTHYGHLAAVAVAAGQRVAAGQQIGDEGSTGHSTGPHLHFEVHLGHFPNPVEPTGWMREHGVDIPGCATG